MYVKRVCLLIAALALSGCDALTIGGSSRVSDNVAVNVGTTITENGIKPRGKLTVGLF